MAIGSSVCTCPLISFMKCQVCTYFQIYLPSLLAAMNDYPTILQGKIALVYFWHPLTKCILKDHWNVMAFKILRGSTFLHSMKIQEHKKCPAESQQPSIQPRSLHESSPFSVTAMSCEFFILGVNDFSQDAHPYIYLH